MPKQNENSRVVWLGAGVIAGLCIGYFWPHEPVAAASNDRSSKFGMLTTPVGVNVDGVFVLDYLTGRLSGAVMNTNTGKFGLMYVRPIAADFGIAPKVTPQYAFVGGRASVSKRGAPPAQSVIYIAELTSGKVIAYGMSLRGGVPTKLDLFQFRPAAPPGE